MTLKVSVVCTSLVLLCFGTSYSQAGYGKAEPEPTDVVDQGVEIEDAFAQKVCQMTCTSKARPSKSWKEDSFWTVIRGGYTCHMQRLGEKMLQETQYATIVITSVDPDTNVTGRYYAHSGVLALLSERIRSEVNESINRHVFNSSRDRTDLPRYEWPPLKRVIIQSILDYIYTYRMRTNNPEEILNNIVGIYVGAYFTDLYELMDLIDKHLVQQGNVVRHLKELVLYIRWSHDRISVFGERYNRLKERLVDIARRMLNMEDQEEFDRFIRNICEPNGYYRGPGTVIPGGLGAFIGSTFVGPNNIDEFRDRYNRTGDNRPPYDNRIP